MITPECNFPSPSSSSPEDNYTIISKYNLLVHTLPKLTAEDHMTCIPHYMYVNTQHNVNTHFSMFTVSPVQNWVDLFSCTVYSTPTIQINIVIKH